MQIVTPCAQWTYQESHNLRGSPATHAVEDGSDKTLCGKVPNDWMWQNWNGADMLELVTCKTCKRLLTKRAADLPSAEGGQASLFNLEELQDVSRFGTASG